MMRKIFSAAALSLVFGTGMLWAQTSPEKHLPLDGSIAPTGQAVELSWAEAKPPRVGSVTVNRRVLGQSGGSSWQALGPASGPVMRFVDDTVQPGVAYEYQVIRSARDIVDVGYWTTGVDLPAIAERGTVYLVIDETVSDDLAAHLDRFERDLTGDGWRVLRQAIARDVPGQRMQNLQSVIALKNGLRGHYQRDPFGQHAIVLVGRVPILLTGQVAPDGHKAQPHASDLFYAEMNGQWRVTADGTMLENTLPSDAIEMQVGRIDFSPVSGRDKAREVALLRAYFDKNHHWRMGFIGDLRGGYGKTKHLTAEQYGLRNILGAQAVETGGHHDVGEREPWLWGVDFGHHDGGAYAENYANKAVFAINFGSGKQKIEKRNNAMTALLAQPWYPVAVGWGGRPAWWLHHMALGGTIGEVHKRSVNNGIANGPYRETMDYYPTGTYLFRNPVWVNLLGDPTLRAFPLAGPARVTTDQTDQGVLLSWDASPDRDVTGYRVWRADSGGQAFVPLDGGVPQAGLTFLDKAPVDGALYMVRAYGLKDVYAGSFHTLSQAGFSRSGKTLAQDMMLEAPAGRATPLPAIFNAPQDGRIHALIEGPVQGRLMRTETGWSYMPPAGFTGTQRLRFSVSDALHTDQAQLTITVTP